MSSGAPRTPPMRAGGSAACAEAASARRAPSPHRAGTWPNATAQLGGTTFGPGLGSVFPLGLQFISYVVPPTALITGEARPEQAQQAFLSRLLLLLGSFVILCLLLF
mmetsp:Transcript_20879/g.70098  ORF Transcript_20879/g.70098 Transcript_20879/m.70098 type:complete len:107 (-) Transcript_20879:607-927(-)